MAEVIENQGREDDEVPARTNRFLSEVTHVCVKRFGARNRKEDGAEDDHAKAGIFHKEADGHERIESTHQLGGLFVIFNERCGTAGSDTDEPD